MKFDLLANLDVPRLSSCENRELQEALNSREANVRNLLTQCAFVLKCIARAKHHTKTKKQLRIGIIGAGLVAQDLVASLLKNPVVKTPSNICVCCRSTRKSRAHFAEPVQLTTDPSHLTSAFGARLIFLCCPAQGILQIAKDIEPKPSVIFCSILAEVSQPSLCTVLRTNQVVCLRSLSTNPAIQFHRTQCTVDKDTAAQQLSKALIVQCSALGLPIEEAQPLCESIMRKHREENLPV